MARYDKKSQQLVGKEMRKFKRGALKIGGKSRQRVKNPKQAIAIGLSEARRKGFKVPPRPRRKKN